MSLYGTYYKEENFSQKAPKDINLSFLTQKNFDDFIKNKFTIFETVNGVYFRLIFQLDKDKKQKINVYLDKKNSSNEKKIIDLINKNYIKSTYKLFKDFGEVNMCFYGVFSSSENDSSYVGEDSIYFYDLFLNDNHLRNDDLLSLFESLGIPTLNTFKKSVYLTNELITEMDEFIKSGVKKSFYLKSDIELYSGNREEKNGNFVYYGEGIQKKRSKKEESQAKEIAEDIVDNVTSNKYVTTGWEATLNAMKIPIFKENKSKILSILVKKFNSIYSHRISSAAEENNVFEDEIEKYIKKYLPKVIIEKLNIGS